MMYYSLMPRQVRVEYEGAIYHVMARGNRRELIVRDDEDRERFEKTLGEVIGQTGWILYAYVLMGNHYHLVFKTPQANLVQGMTWFQSTLTKRYNAKHRVRGHLFSGRYKSVLVEQNEYLNTLIHYVHLNPARAKMLSPKDGVESYPWSSLPDYCKPVSKRRNWISVERGLGQLGYEDSTRKRRSFLEETERLVDRSKLSRAGVVKMEGVSLNTSLKRGWCFGSDAFREKMLGLLGSKLKAKESEYRAENGYTGQEIRDHSEADARKLIDQALLTLELEKDELLKLRKLDPKKAMIVRLIRRHTRVKLDWIARELRMGVRSSVTLAEKRLKEELKNDLTLRKLWRKIEK
jgi:putative transposase